jgi:hypothetical protein
MPSFVQDLMMGLGKGYFIPKNSFLFYFVTPTKHPIDRDKSFMASNNPVIS